MYHIHRIRQLMEASLAFYAVYFPLDFYGELGDNVSIAQQLGLEEIQTFGR